MNYSNSNILNWPIELTISIYTSLNWCMHACMCGCCTLGHRSCVGVAFVCWHFYASSLVGILKFSYILGCMGELLVGKVNASKCRRQFFLLQRFNWRHNTMHWGLSRGWTEQWYLSTISQTDIHIDIYYIERQFLLTTLSGSLVHILYL